MAQQDLSKQLTNFMKNYRKAQENAQSFEAAVQNMGQILNTGSTDKKSDTEAAKKITKDTNTLVSAIRDNIFNAKGFNSMLADQRRSQVLDILGVTPKTSSSSETSTPVETVGEDVIEYTYKPGDTFGQVINDLGLRTNNGLWGPNGDVEYYSQQLREQGINGNIPAGTVIKLRRRK